jgi:uncharacterized membrane protein (UPF0136 family)
MHTAFVTALSIYGLLVFVGGVIGYLKAKSRASLIAGLGSALLLGVASSVFSSGAVRLGAALGGVIALALIGRFAPAFMKTKKVRPAGLVVAMGVLVLALAVANLVRG